MQKMNWHIYADKCVAYPHHQYVFTDIEVKNGTEIAL